MTSSDDFCIARALAKQDTRIGRHRESFSWAAELIMSDFSATSYFANPSDLWSIAFCDVV